MRELLFVILIHFFVVDNFFSFIVDLITSNSSCVLEMLTKFVGIRNGTFELLREKKGGKKIYKLNDEPTKAKTNCKID